ncbi:MAG: response regulator transcription factor [Bacteroidetes bacterium]|nr:response regulator transcription factor [Bacteroidota bacterium]
MANKKVRVAIADSNVFFRRLLAKYINEQGNFRICIETSDMADLILYLQNFPVEIVVIDFLDHQTSGIDNIKNIITKFSEIKIIVLSSCTNLSLIGNLIDLGIFAFVSKFDEPNSLIKSFESAMENKLYRNYFFTEALFFKNEKRNSLLKRFTKIDLDERERRIIQLLWAEKTNQEIAKEIYLSIRSVEKMRQKLKQKIGFKSIAGLFQYALDEGIIISNLSTTMNFREQISQEHE